LLDRIADKWTTLVMGLLEPGPKRFTTLRHELEGISQKMLTQTLRGLERDGIVRRTMYPQIPPRVEYSLTPLGHTLCEPLAAIRQWAEEHGEEVSTAQTAYDERIREGRQLYA
jgi:DNA-binding HxlR family transcriptional regulator